MRFPRTRPRCRQEAEAAAGALSTLHPSSLARGRAGPQDLRIPGLKVLGHRSGTLRVPLRLTKVEDSQFAPVSGVIAEG